MTDFHEALVERVARAIADAVGVPITRAEMDAAATAALTASGLDEAIEALAALVGGKCPECEGWGEVAHFGEMVDCRCGGSYRHQPSEAALDRARAALAKLRGQS